MGPSRACGAGPLSRVATNSSKTLLVNLNRLILVVCLARRVDLKNGFSSSNRSISAETRPYVGCPQDAAKALPLLQQAAELGESDALAYLGAAFMEGWAVAKDEAKAVAYLRLAARRDHADALNDLAAALASGTGTNVDKAQAARLFQRAAERGHSRAAAYLANLANPQ